MGQMPELGKEESHSKSGDGWYIFKPPELAHFQSAIDIFSAKSSESYRVICFIES